MNVSLLSTEHSEREISCCNESRKRENPPGQLVVNENRLAEELNALTVQERNDVYDEVHGVNEVIQETPEFVADSLEKMRLEISKISKPKRRALNRAIFLKPSLEHDDKFHLAFLRSVRFDTTEAAKRICNHFEHKIQLFGEEKLVKKITFEDLSKEDKEVMSQGPVEAIHTRDRQGRALNFAAALRFNMDVNKWDSFARVIWYHAMTLIEDEAVQIHGVIYLLSLIGADLKTNRKLFEIQWQCRNIIPFLPTRPCAVHLCYDNPHLHQFAQALFQYVLPKELRLRVRCHFGSAQEVRYQLLTFGIPTGAFFDDPQGADAHRMMAAELDTRKTREDEQRRSQEEAEASGTKIAYPNKNDMLVGRGRPYRDHPGGRMLAAMAAECVEEYRSTERRAEKTQISMDLVERIKAKQGRFLQRTPSGWEVVDDWVAREKVSQVLRMEVRLRTEREDSAGSPVDQHHSEEDTPQPKRQRGLH